mmetsp:Transcript_15864/g.17605  ORF Transcript_15864/g.17605 Transcript_15864/m.17605 type:complete len:123 (-) Transcript_15864:19-387(-)
MINKSKLFSNILSVRESRESESLKFATDTVAGLSTIITGDDDESEHLEQDIQKLESLKHVHEQSAQVFNKISALQESQQNILASLGDDQKALEYIKSSLGENLKTIKENMANIKERIAKLKA